MSGGVVIVHPDPPAWAVEAGIPAPWNGETFVRYCVRIGIPLAVAEDMLDGLTERTAPCANDRLGTYLMRQCPDAFWAHVERLRQVVGERATNGYLQSQKGLASVLRGVYS